MGPMEVPQQTPQIVKVVHSQYEFGANYVWDRVRAASKVCLLQRHHTSNSISQFHVSCRQRGRQHEGAGNEPAAVTCGWRPALSQWSLMKNLFLRQTMADK